MTHAFTTIAIPFSIEKAAAVDGCLEAMAPELRDSDGPLREALKGQGVHFMSITAVRGDGPEPTHLVLEMSSDGDTASAINMLAKQIAPWLSKIFSAAGLAPSDAYEKFLQSHVIKTGQGLFDVPGLDFTGSPGMTVERIRAEARLAREVREYFDTTATTTDALETVKAVRKHISEQAELAPLLTPLPVPRLAPSGKIDGGLILGLAGRGIALFLWPLLILLLLATIIAGSTAWPAGALAVFGIVTATLVAAVVAIIGTVLFLYFRLRRAENLNTPDDSLPDAARLEDVMRHENWSAQNHLAGVSVMQPGWIRKLTLRVAFWVILQMAQRVYRPGYLADIGTIHFARWVLLPNTNKLLFFSNYGGSWESYLEDFITKAANGLTGAWSNTSGFPRTSNLFQNGATDSERFKRWARRQQQPSRFWYSAYPRLTTARIRRNAAVRAGLGSVATADEAKAWLSLFGSRVLPAATIETREVQQLLFGGLRKHPFAECNLITLSAVQAKAREFLAENRNAVSFGDLPPGDVVSIIGLSATGLQKLGLPSHAFHDLPPAFRQGMAHPVRSNILADTGQDKPARWSWSDNNQVDVVINTYAVSAKQLAAHSKQLSASVEGLGGKIVHTVTLSKLDFVTDAKGRAISSREAFGFADGISQPIIKGTKRFLRDSDTIHVVEPGEFILGYPDNRGFVPPAIALAATDDPLDILPVATQAHRGADLPDFSLTGANALRDFGRNGSFLVVRQMEQDVETFDKFISTAANTHSDHPGMPQHLSADLKAEWIGAKMVGRWKDGSSLFRYPNHPATKANQVASVADNDFLPGAEDPAGLRCPLGAHVRRANPRDSLTPGSKDQIDISNRHRILRVGRTYDAAGSGLPEADKPGLLFMCFNADIERQFEFIQQTWAMAWQFHELENEVDPILVRGVGQDGKPRALARFTIPTERGSIQLTGIKDFVKIRGGGYFFVPSRSALTYLSTAQPNPAGESIT